MPTKKQHFLVQKVSIKYIFNEIDVWKGKIKQKQAGLSGIDGEAMELAKHSDSKSPMLYGYYILLKVLQPGIYNPAYFEGKTFYLILYVHVKKTG